MINHLQLPCLNLLNRLHPPLERRLPFLAGAPVIGYPCFVLRVPPLVLGVGLGLTHHGGGLLPEELDRFFDVVHVRSLAQEYQCRESHRCLVASSPYYNAALLPPVFRAAIYRLRLWSSA